MAVPTSRATLIEYALRRLGDPVIEINIDPDQQEDRVDDTIALYQEFHSDATIKTYLKHLVTTDDVTNKYITLSSDVLYVSRLYPTNGTSTGSSSGVSMFDLKYQMHLNDLRDLSTYAFDMAYYNQMQQHLSMIDLVLTGTPITNFSRRENRLYIYGELGTDVKAGEYIVAEVYSAVNNSSIYNDMFVKDYTTAAFKQQWGQNLIKFEGMVLPGGVTLNGRQIYDDGSADMEKLRENLRLEQELPPDFFVG